MTFSELELNPKIQDAITEAGFITCTPVQEQTFEHTLVGSDVAVQSQTGTGKTAAFLISIFQLFLEQRELDSRTALIIAPTRELADQIEKDAVLLAKHTGLLTGSFYGGVGYHRQEQLLRDGVRVAIGTPGRLLDFAEQRKLDLSKVGILVIDEADRLFDMGFIPDLRRLIRDMPSREERVTMLFSATLAPRVKALAAEYMRSPAEITIEPEHITVEQVTHELYHVARQRKLSLLLGLLEREKPRNALMFTNTKQAAYELATRLSRNGLRCEYIIGDLPQSRRQRLIDELKAGDIQFLAATDVAARGIHVDDLGLVVNYDLPEYAENYVHRVGRTARVGKSGKAITLACEEYVFGLEAIEEYIGMKLPAAQPDKALYAVDASAGERVGYYANALKAPRDSSPREGASRSSRPRTGAAPRSGDRDRDQRPREASANRGGEQSRPQRQAAARERPPAREGNRDSNRDSARQTDAQGTRSTRARPQSGAGNPPRSGNAGSAQGRAERQGQEQRRREPDAGQRQPGSGAPKPPRAPAAPGQPRREQGSAGNPPRRDQSLDDRLARYRDKYGEDFDASKVSGGAGMAAATEKPKGIRGFLQRRRQAKRAPSTD
jgi:ATP-dependent RNA helicase RhlB